MEEKKNNTFQSLLGKLLEHPEQILGVLNLISSLSGGESTPATVPASAPSEEAENPPFETNVTEETDEAVFLPQGEDAAPPPPEEETVAASVSPRHRKREMLTAIKPYVRDSKRGQIDRILRAAELVDLLRQT